MRRNGLYSSQMAVLCLHPHLCFSFFFIRKISKFSKQKKIASLCKIVIISALMTVTYCHNASHSSFVHSFALSIDFHKFAFTLKLIDEKEKEKLRRGLVWIIKDEEVWRVTHFHNASHKKVATASECERA